MIRWFLLQNRAGRTRLAKYYVPMDDFEKRKTEYEVFRALNGRESKWSNIVEVRPSSFAAPIDPLYTHRDQQDGSRTVRTHV